MGNNVDLNALFGTTTGIIFVLSIFIKIPKIEVNIWGWIARKIGNAMNHDIFIEMNQIKNNLDAHVKKDEADKASFSRKRILRFNDELLHTVYHSREHFVEILSDIDDYEDYCDAHLDYPNNRANLAIENIKRIYSECLRENKFL